MKNIQHQGTRSKNSHTRRFAAVAMAAAIGISGGAAVSSFPGVGVLEQASAAVAVTDTSGSNLVAANTFIFSDASISVTGDGDASNYSISGTDLTINAPGVYKVTGSCADGSISVKKNVENVTIILEDLTLSNDGDKAVKFKQGSSGAIVLKGANTLSTSNDKGIIKANAVEESDDVLAYDSTGHTTGGDLVIYGDGTLDLSSTYSATVDGETEGCDAINCEGDLEILSGTFNISVTDDGMHSDNTLTIGKAGTAGPTINIAKAEEGLEGATVNLYSGTGNITTNDDGINAANKDLVLYGWQYAINIAGGTWAVVAGGDGLDSNGNLTVSGGKTAVYCTGSGNGPVDYGEGQEGEIRGTFAHTGGELLAVGSDMLVTPSSGKFVLFSSTSNNGPGANGQQGGQPGEQGGGQPPANGEQPPEMSSGQQPGGQNGQPPEMPNGQQPGGQNDQQPPEMPGDNGSGQGQQPGQPGTGSTNIVTKGQAFSIADGTNTIYSATALASGSYVLYMSDVLDDSKTYTLKNGDTEIETTVGSTTGGTAKNSGGSNNGTNNEGGENTNGQTDNDDASQSSGDNNAAADQAGATTTNTSVTQAPTNSTKQTTSTSSIAKTDDALPLVGLLALLTGFVGTAIMLLKKRLFF